MKFREIAQHNPASLFIIILLLIFDISAFSFLYNFSFNTLPFSFHIILVLTSFILMVYLSNGYNPSPLCSRKRELKNFIKIFFIWGGGYMIVNRIINNVAFVDMGDMLTFSLHFLLILIVIRLGVRWIQKLFLNAKIGLRDVIILGKGESSINLIKQLKNSPALGYNVVGYISDQNDSK
nr:hypothetical protein [Candidatus Neomarinimicrobiota bacterium]